MVTIVSSINAGNSGVPDSAPSGHGWFSTSSYATVIQRTGHCYASGGRA
ncbi:hypothetical protein ACFRH6_16380 [Streptomyces sp. NPDC056749]